MDRVRMWLWCLVAGILMAAPMSAAAAGEEQQDRETAIQAAKVIVTAQKQEEEQNDVPISMTVVTEQTLEDQQIKSVKDLGSLTPNLLMFENGVSGMISPSFRGLTSDIEARTVPSGMYIDGVPVLAGLGFDEPLMDIQRVEILRGPQGTLYGKNTEAGVINIITRKPGNRQTFRGNVELGEDNKREVSMSVQTPVLKDRLFLGISGRHYEKEGFVTHETTGDTVDDRENNYGKLTLRYLPTRDLEVSLISSILEYDDGASTMNYFGVSEPKVNSDLDGYNRSSSAMSVLKIGWDLGSRSHIESISSWRDYDIDTGQDWDFSSATGYHVFRKGRNTTLAQELRFNSSVTDRFVYTTGLYLEKNDDEMRVETNLYNISTDFDTRSLGLFGHAEFKATDLLSLIGGIRYDDEDKKIFSLDEDINKEASFNAISPKLAVQYKLGQGAMTWISASKGYRSGGFSTFIVNGDASAFDEEQLWSYEIGVKQVCLDGKLGINASIYYMDIDDMQVQEPISGDMEITTNAAKAESKGIEIELTAQVTRALSLFAGGGYNDIQFNAFSDANGDYAGNRVPFAPRYNFNMGGRYRSLSGIYTQLKLTGYGDMYFDKANAYKKSAFALVGARVGYETEHMDIYIYAKNLFNETYNSEGYYNGYYTIYSPPREIGIQAGFRF